MNGFTLSLNDDAETLKNQIIKLIQRGLGQSEGRDYEALERPHQYWVRKRLFDLAETNGKQWDAMLELAPRFGKTSCIMGIGGSTRMHRCSSWRRISFRH